MVCPNALITPITVISALLAEGQSNEDIDLLYAIFTQLSDTLATIATTKGFCESKNSEKDPNEKVEQSVTSPLDS